MIKKFKIIWKYLKPYKFQVFLNFLFNFIQVYFALFSLALIIPFLDILFNQTQQVANLPQASFSKEYVFALLNYKLNEIIQTQGKTQALFIVSAFVVSMTFLKNFFIYMANFFMASIRNGIIKDIRNIIYKKIVKLPIAYFSEEKKGDIMSRITNDVSLIESSIMSAIQIVVREPLIIIFFIAGLLFLSPELTIFVLILLPVSGWFIGSVGRTLRKKSKQAQDQMGQLQANVEETLSGLRIIKAFNAQNKVIKRFMQLNEKYAQTMTKMLRRNYLASPLSEFLGVTMLIIILYYGGTMVLNSESSLTSSQFIGYITIFSQIINPAKNFSKAFYQIQLGMAAIDRVNKIIDAEIAIKDAPDAIEIKKFEHSIELRNVWFKYKESNDYVLKNINLTIKKGQTVALVGQSGSGKSTLVDLIPRFHDIQKGEILIDGINIKKLKINDLRNLMGNVNQDPILFNDTIFNNIAFGVDNPTIEEVEKAAKVANAHNFIIEKPDGYQTNIGDRGNKLSGGQKQRISIARAVLKNPPIMILDEATSALDTESERLVQDALNRLMQNRTSIVIAHRLSTVKHADLICVVHEGRIIESGKHQDLIELDGVYKKLCDMQMF